MQYTNFKELIDSYKVIFFDSFGVLRNHKGVIEGVANTLNYLDEQQKPFYVVTNDASRGRREIAARFAESGISSITPEKVISSGMLAREYLRHKIKEGRIAYLGTKNSAHYIETTGLKTRSIHDLDLDNIDDITGLVFLDDEGFDWNEDINKAVNLLRRKNIPVIVANTDVNYPVAKNEIAIAVGGIANMVESIIGKTFIRFGKPDAQIFMFTYELLEGQGIRKDEILMVGDTLKTDIIGANKFGIDTVLVLSGNTPARKAEMRIESTGIIPNYVCESIAIK